MYISSVRADFRAENLLTGTRRGRLHIEVAKLWVGLHVGIVIGRQPGPEFAFDDSASGRCWKSSLRRGKRGPLVMDAFSIGATVGLELRFDPIDGRAVAISTLPAVTEFGQRLDGCLVALQVEPSDQRLDWIVRRVVLSTAETHEENPCDQQQCFRARERKISSRVSHFSIPPSKGDTSPVPFQIRLVDI
jgi:hypothetical protein